MRYALNCICTSILKACICYFCRVNSVSEQILNMCKELIDDAKVNGSDLVFKEVCLDVLSRARHVLSDVQFDELLFYAEERLKEQRMVEVAP